MNKDKYIATTNLQEKTLNLKKYSDKIKLLYSTPKNNASLALATKSLASLSTSVADRNREVSVLRLRSEGKAEVGEKVKNNNTNPSRPEAHSVGGLGLLSSKPTWTNHPKIQAIYQQKEQSEQTTVSLSALGTGREESRGGIELKSRTKTPLVRISGRLHRHIKSVGSALGSAGSEKFNSEIANNNTIVYNFNNNFKKFKLTSILENSFFSINRLISKPVLNIKPNKIIIQLFFFKKNSERLTNLANLLKSKSMQLQDLCTFLSKNLKKPVEFELIRLHHPSLESNILANTIGYIAKNTRKTFRVIMLKLFKSTKIKKFNEFKYTYNIRKFKPTALVGIRIKLGGRLLSQKIVPRFTSRTIQRGNLGKTKADFITTSRFTNKNKRGAFSFTVTMGHKFF